ncbi:hypothetical protein Goshw_000858 [Gossypium schwendimanii]|uniref:Uncharacterized protein n=1 Tax=Gossypium schwendimanii TaxID=34291 RepID=A0A7J9MGW3_GOSSC|nr:hypothetical protein [Gossypium schwendimanii]
MGPWKQRNLPASNHQSSVTISSTVHGGEDRGDSTLARLRRCCFLETLGLHYETKMARQLVVLALVLIALASVISVAASSPGGSPPSARTRASTDGSATSSSRRSQATATSPTGDVPLDLEKYKKK